MGQWRFDAWLPAERANSGGVLRQKIRTLFATKLEAQLSRVTPMSPLPWATL